MECNVETGKSLFSRFIKGEPATRPAFVPLIGGVLPRVAGISLKELNADATLWANSLQKTVELFDFDGVVLGFDFSLMAEACGCGISWEGDRPIVSCPAVTVCPVPEENGRMRYALEAARRVISVCGSDRACVVALTGPATLSAQLFGREQGAERAADCKGLLVRVTEEFCRLRPDGLVLMEEGSPAMEGMSASQRRIYNTLRNIAGYYTIPAGLYLQGYQPGALRQCANLKMDFYILGPSQAGGLPVLSDLWELGEHAVGVGIGLPVDNPERTREFIRQGVEYCRAGEKRGFFFTSCGEIDRAVDLGMLRQMTEEIRQVRL
jgi:hypothetical protein